jgi:hypothetical protein
VRYYLVANRGVGALVGWPQAGQGQGRTGDEPGQGQALSLPYAGFRMDRSMVGTGLAPVLCSCPYISISSSDDSLIQFIEKRLEGILCNALTQGIVGDNNWTLEIGHCIISQHRTIRTIGNLNLACGID